MKAMSKPLKRLINILIIGRLYDCEIKAFFGIMI